MNTTKLGVVRLSRTQLRKSFTNSLHAIFWPNSRVVSGASPRFSAQSVALENAPESIAWTCRLAQRSAGNREAPAANTASTMKVADSATCLSILFLTALQGVYAGVHWPSDVLGGYLWGGLLLFVVIGAYELCQGRLSISRGARPGAIPHPSVV